MATDIMHLGRKISRIREIKGMKQETLANVLGVSQQTVSKLEQSEHIDDDRLEEVSKALGVPVEAIRNFDEEKAVTIITNSITNNDNSSVYGHYTFNPLEKVIELYERMLNEKDEKIVQLQKLLDKK